jgi:hypothetical protein
MEILKSKIKVLESSVVIIIIIIITALFLLTHIRIIFYN